MKNNHVYFEIEEICDHLKSLKLKKDKINYLIFLRDELVKICYHITDDEIGLYLKYHNKSIKFEILEYSPFGDIAQSHISRSEYIHFLEHIDRHILPYVRNEIFKLDKTIKEDENKIIKDYKIFNFDVDKVLNYSNELNIDQVGYLSWVFKEYYNYQWKRYKRLTGFDDNNSSEIKISTSILKHPFCLKIRSRIKLLKRYPNVKILNSYKSAIEDLNKYELSLLFQKNKLLCEFNFTKIKEYAKKLNSTKDQILYLEDVIKEVKQHINLLKKNNSEISLVDKIEIELNFYKQKLELERTETNIDQNQENIKLSSSVMNKKKNESKKIQWLQDETLLIYLFEMLYRNGCVSKSDYDYSLEFIEKYFINKKGASFKRNNLLQSRTNLLSNIKKGEPRNAYKIKSIFKIKD